MGGKLGFGVVIGIPVTYLIVIGGFAGGSASVCEDVLLSQQCSYKKETRQSARFLLFQTRSILFYCLPLHRGPLGSSCLPDQSLHTQSFRNKVGLWQAWPLLALRDNIPAEMIQKRLSLPKSTSAQYCCALEILHSLIQSPAGNSSPPNPEQHMPNWQCTRVLSATHQHRSSQGRYHLPWDNTLLVARYSRHELNIE